MKRTIKLRRAMDKIYSPLVDQNAARQAQRNADLAKRMANTAVRPEVKRRKIP